MTQFVIKIYDLFKKRPMLAAGLFILMTAGLVLSLLTLSYKEDISDFLPLDEKNQTALSVYQDISGANKIYAIVSDNAGGKADPDSIVAGIESFAGIVEESDSLGFLSGITKTVDMDNMISVMDEVYENIPYFLAEEDIERIDSLLSTPGYVESRLIEARQFLMFPASNVVSRNISKDPLNLFTPVLGRLQQGGMPISFDTYDGYILSPDGEKGVIIMESSFGANESENNAKLVSLLDEAVAKSRVSNPGIDIHIIGGPVIAVSNANQIKSDSILAVCIAGILILLLLVYVFRNVRNILLIVVSVGWGWLFAMGCIALFYDSVSIIVVGISSVILGIAVNYPLHLIDHMKDSMHPRSALKEIISPLVVGNVTTVGAFLCLVPLNAPALHDLGLFSSLVLVGTILFVLLFLPQVVKTGRHGVAAANPALITKLANISLDTNRYVVWGVLVMTCVFAYFSLDTEFDSDMRNINYMTDTQKSDMDYFQSLLGTGKDTESVYIVSNGSTWDEALSENEKIDKDIDLLGSSFDLKKHNQVSRFLSSRETQSKKIERWNSLIEKHRGILTDTLDMKGVETGFNSEAFAQFREMISQSYKPKDIMEFNNLLSTVFVGNISIDKQSGRCSVVQTIEVAQEDVGEVKDRLSADKEFGGLVFDVKSMNGSIANTLSDDFNYIGLACGCIVFIFLWISFGSIELAIVSFLPMAISWIWILGIMSLLGIRFNIVNVILATFIFGQGDDYTIFMTEGLMYEFAYRRKLLASYKNSIIVSALIMFIGIGTLIFAEHPALKSLGEVTVVGMLSVVMMAYLFPPLVFNWLVRKNGVLRYRPVTLKGILTSGISSSIIFLQLTAAYITGLFLFVVTKSTPGKRAWFRKATSSMFRFDMKHLPAMKSSFRNTYSDTFDKPAVIVSNQQSLLNYFFLLSLSPEIKVLINENMRLNPLVRLILKWNNSVIFTDDKGNVDETLMSFLGEGFSIAIFPEEEIGYDIGKTVRFYKKGLHIAAEFKSDLLPVYFYRLADMLQARGAMSLSGTSYIEIGKRISADMIEKTGDSSLQAEMLGMSCERNLMEIHHRVMNIHELSGIVFDRYLYKGRDIEMKAAGMLKRIKEKSGVIENLPGCHDIEIYDLCGQGELAIVCALLYPAKNIVCHMKDADSRMILEGCLEDFISNISVVDETSERNTDSTLFVVTSEKKDTYPDDAILI